MSDIDIGKALRQARKKAGMTQEQFGEMIGISQQAVSAYERGLYDPDADKNFWDMIKKRTGVDISRLKGFSLCPDNDEDKKKGKYMEANNDQDVSISTEAEDVIKKREGDEETGHLRAMDTSSGSMLSLSFLKCEDDLDEFINVLLTNAGVLASSDYYWCFALKAFLKAVLGFLMLSTIESDQTISSAKRLMRTALPDYDLYTRSDWESCTLMDYMMDGIKDVAPYDFVVASYGIFRSAPSMHTQWQIVLSCLAVMEAYENAAACKN